MEVDNIKKALVDCDSEKTALNIKFDNLKEEKVTLESQIYEIQLERDELQKELDSEKASCLKFDIWSIGVGQELFPHKSFTGKAP